MRINYIDKISQNLPNAYDLSKLFNPKSLFATYLLSLSKQYSLNLERVKFSY